MRRRLGVSCESPNSFCSQLYPLRTPSCGTASSLSRTPVISTNRGLVSASVNASGHARTVENEPRASAAVPPSGGAPAPHLFGSNVANNVVMGVTPGRGQGIRTDAGSVATTATTTTATRSGAYASAPESSALLDDFLLEHMHRAPTGMADRIAAASERHENRQRGQQQQGQQPQPQTQPQQGGLRKSPQGPAHDPEGSRLWEARLLSRACQSLAFHISSHFHVPADPSDPLSSVLSASTSPSTTVTTASGSPMSGSGTYTPSLLLLLPPLPMPPPPAPHGGVTVGLGADLTAPGQNGDLHGVYDNLPAVYALKAVAGSLLDPALWRVPLPLPQPPSKPLRTSANTPPNSSHSHSHPLDQQSPGGKEASPQPLHAAYPGAAAAGAQGPHSEAPSAMNALIHVVAGALLRLAHACGHSGCYTLIGQPRPPPPSLLPGGAAPAPLAGVSFATDRQLARLYDMAGAAGDVDVGALAGVPGSTAAALLVLLAAAQPPPHPAVAAATARPAGDAAVAASSGGGGPPTIPAALLARYLRVGSRSHNPLDTVRVMWALLRLQLPGAGSLLLPLQPGGDNSSSSDDEDGAAAITGVSPPQDAMTQLAAILSRQLRNRDRALAALRAARPGELYGTWQLAVQTLVLLRDRAAAAERSAAALEQLDSALALLEAALTGSESGSGSGPESGSGSGSASPEIGAVHVGAQQHHHQGRRRTGDNKGTAGGEPVGAGSPTATPPAVGALQAFLDMSREVSAAREEAAAAAAAAAASATACGADPFFSPAGPTPTWDVVPRSDAEWRGVLGDTEQRAALLLSTWPELGRLVEPPPPSPPPPPRQAQQPQQAAAAGTEAEAEGKAGAGEEPGQGTCPVEAVGGAAGGPGGSGAEQAAATEKPEGAVQRRRLRLHLQSYSAMHFRTLELLYRAVKAQAPDARLLAPLSAPDAAAAAVAASTADAAPGAATGGGGGDDDDAAASSRRILDAVALPYSAAVDMVFTDARGRRVGLCLAHLGASRRAPGELAVLQHALAGWPEADAAAAQQGFRAARAVAAAAAAHAKARAARTADAVATASVMVGAAAAAVAAAAGDAAARPWTGDDAAVAVPQGPAVPDEAVAAVTTAVDAAAVRTVPAAGGDDDDCLSVEERALAETAAAALEADAAAAAAAPGAAAAAAAEAAAAAARAAGPPVAGLEDPGRRQVLELDDVVVLELDHDWFHLRESYYDHVRQTDKWDEDVRQAVGAAMSYTVLPWEAQLDMVWHVLGGAGVRLPIRVFA